MRQPSSIPATEAIHPWHKSQSSQGLCHEFQHKTSLRYGNQQTTSSACALEVAPLSPENAMLRAESAVRPAADKAGINQRCSAVFTAPRWSDRVIRSGSKFRNAKLIEVRRCCRGCWARAKVAVKGIRRYRRLINGSAAVGLKRRMPWLRQRKSTGTALRQFSSICPAKDIAVRFASINKGSPPLASVSRNVGWPRQEFGSV